MTACPGKILEKIIGDRLIFILERKKLISDNQAGFRPSRCTTDQILKLVQEASDQIHAKGKKKSHRTVTAFFDYAKAYDKVWRDGLLTKMIDLEIPKRFIGYVRHFLSGRKTTVEVNGRQSKTFLLQEGLPQGSSISPILFLVFINDIDVDLDASTTASLFADDTSLWRKDGDVRGSDRKLMQDEIDKILKWAHDWKMQVNTSKTKVMVVSSNRADLVWDPSMEAAESPIECVKQYRFLGVTISNDLRFKAHINAVIDSCKKRVNVIKCMSSKDWGNSVETQRNLVLQYVLSRLEYAAPSWSPWISKTDMRRLQTILNDALRTVVGLAKTCPQDFLHLEAGIEPLVDKFRKLNELTWERYARLPEEDARSQLISKRVPPRLKTRLGWRHLTEGSMQEMQFERATTRIETPPWRGTPFKFDAVSLVLRKEKYSQTELKRKSVEKIASLDTEIIVYTDGSTNGNQENGGAGVYIEDTRTGEQHEFSYPAGKLCSSYGSECLALLKALEWIQTNPGSSTICTDSLSLQQALRNNNWKDNNDLLMKIKGIATTIDHPITLLWVPSHCDLEGNEKADELANQGSKLCQVGIPVSHEIVKARIKRRKWSVTHERAKETYGGRKSPRFDVDKQWPRSVRSLFARLRTGHAKELKLYTHLI